VNQMCEGFVDGIAWGSLSKEERSAQIQHIHRGDNYHIAANGGVQQQLNIATQNDL